MEKSRVFRVKPTQSRDCKERSPSSQNSCFRNEPDPEPRPQGSGNRWPKTTMRLAENHRPRSPEQGLLASRCLKQQQASAYSTLRSSVCILPHAEDICEHALRA